MVLDSASRNLAIEAKEKGGDDLPFFFMVSLNEGGTEVALPPPQAGESGALPQVRSKRQEPPLWLSSRSRIYPTSAD